MEFLSLALIFAFIKQINEYEEGILFRFGKYRKTLKAGWHLVIPVLYRLKKIDMRIKAIDVPDQEAMTKDNIPCHINAVIYYRVKDAAKAYIKVENFYYATNQLAQTTMRNIIGEVTLDDLLSKREKISSRIKELVESASDPWGIEVQGVELKDIILNDELKRVMAKQAEAERERRAVIIKAEGEVIASKDLAAAAKNLSAADGALHIRTLQAINDMSSDQSNTVIFTLPLEILNAMGGMKKK